MPLSVTRAGRPRVGTTAGRRGHVYGFRRAAALEEVRTHGHALLRGLVREERE